MPRKGYASSSGIATPRWRKASTPSGISPSPQGLSIGGTAPSATTTLKPWRRAAIAVARPAGPPPTTNTSHGFGRRVCIDFVTTDSVTMTVGCAISGPRRLPLQQKEFRAETGAHRGQQAQRAGRGGAIFHDFFEHHQHRGGGQISRPAQALPRDFEFSILQAQSLGSRFQNFRTTG